MMSKMRNREALEQVEAELMDRIWLNRWFREIQHPLSPTTVAPDDPNHEQLLEMGLSWEREAYEDAYEMLERFGHEALVNTAGLAVLLGKLSAIRWMLDKEWDYFYEDEWDENEEPFLGTLDT